MADPADGRGGTGGTVDYVPCGLFLRTCTQFFGRRRHESASGLGHGSTDGIVGLSSAVGWLRAFGGYIHAYSTIFYFYFCFIRHVPH